MDSGIQTLIGGLILLGLSGLGALVFKHAKLARMICYVLIGLISLIDSYFTCYRAGKDTAYYDAIAIAHDSAFHTLNPLIDQTAQNYRDKIEVLKDKLGLLGFSTWGMYNYIIIACLIAIGIFSKIYETTVTDKDKKIDKKSIETTEEKIT